MKIILKQDVKTIGKKDEIHEVSDGYARNFLFPRNLAAPADAAALNQARTKSEAKAHTRPRHAPRRGAGRQDQGPGRDRQGQGRCIRQAVRQGHRQGGCRAADRPDRHRKSTKKKVELPSAIKEFGSYDASVRLYAGVVAPFKLKVEEL